MSRSDMAGTAHKLASLRGLTAQVMDPGSNAATEIEGLWNWLCAELHLGTPALVHKGAA
jgi:chromosome partitioning protein